MMDENYVFNYCEQTNEFKYLIKYCEKTMRMVNTYCHY